MSAQNWPAGTVCRATVRGVPEKFGMWECNGYFFTPLPARGVKLHKASLVTDVRPLVVIDPADAPDGVHGVANALRSADRRGDHLEHSPMGKTLRWLADEFERQTTPPRMAEPEWGERVLAHTEGNTERREFVRFWAAWSDRDDSYDWADLLDPVGGAE